MFYKGKRIGVSKLARIEASYYANKLYTARKSNSINDPRNYPNILNHHKNMQQLEKIFYEATGLSLEFTLSQYKEGVLYVFCNNAVVASSFRYSSAEYIKKLSQYTVFKDLHSIKTRVNFR